MVAKKCDSAKSISCPSVRTFTKPPSGTRLNVSFVSSSRVRLMRLFKSIPATTATLLFACFVARPAGAAPSPLPPEVGFSRGELESPRSAAMGGALRALGNSLDGLYLNPANMAATRVYHLGGVAQLWPQAGRQSYGGAAVDSILNPERIAGGLAVTSSEFDPDGLQRSVWDFRLGLALPFSEQVFFGATVKHLDVTQDGHPAGTLSTTVAAGGLQKESILRQTAVDVGLTVRPIPELALAVVGVNVTNPKTALMPTLVSGGVGFGNTDFSLEADVGFDFTTFEKTKMQLQGGAEVLIVGQVPVRAGYMFDEAFARHAVSAGAGYLANEFSVDAALRISVSGPTATAIVLGVRYHLDGAGIVTAAE